MSKENVKNFYEMLKVDANLAQELMKLKEELEKGDKKFLNDEYVINEKIIPLAKKHGLDFTADEFTSFSTKLLNKLDEEDLLKVSGGGTFGNIVAAVMSFLQSFIPMPFSHNATNVTDTAQVIQAEGQQHRNIPAPDMQENEPKPLADTLLELAQFATAYINSPMEGVDRILFLGRMPDRDLSNAVSAHNVAYNIMRRFALGRNFVNRLDGSKPIKSALKNLLNAAKVIAPRENFTNFETFLNSFNDYNVKSIFVALVYHLLAYRVGGVRNVGNFNYDEALNAHPELKKIFDSANVEELRAILEQ